MEDYIKKKLKKIILSIIFSSTGFFLMLILILACAVAGAMNSNEDKTHGNVEATVTQEAFINNMIAFNELAKEKGIFPSVMLAQASIESDWGTSDLTIKANNLFGVKAYNWSGDTIEMNTQEDIGGGNMITISSYFRKYNSWDDSIKDYLEFFHANPRYAENGVFEAKNYKEQLEAIKRSGYATASNYAEVLCNRIEEYGWAKYDE